MKKTLLSTTAALVLGAGIAFAQTSSDQIIADLQAQGFTRVEITNGPTQIKVEAIRGTEKLEVIYDAATGTIIKQEMETVGAGDDTTPGVEIDSESEDFLDDDDDDDQDDDYDDD